MPSTGELVLVSATVLILLASGWWTGRRYQRFAQLPAHYDFRGNPTRFSARTTMAWLLPVMFSVLLVVLTFVIANVPDELRNGDPVTATVFSCITLLGAQGLVLWLLARWAREQ